MSFTTTATLAYGVPLVDVTSWVGDHADGDPVDGCKLLMVGSDGYPTPEMRQRLRHALEEEMADYFLAIDGALLRADLGEFVRMSDRRPLREPTWDATLAAFIAKHGLTVQEDDGKPAKPGWWLMASRF